MPKKGLYEKYKEKIKQYRDKKENKEKQRIYYRKWYKKNGRTRSVDYLEATYEWRKKYPEKRNAHEIVQRAVKSGKLIKPKHCDKCHKEANLSGHHEDYSKPLLVLWLCNSCHKLIHISKLDK